MRKLVKTAKQQFEERLRGMQVYGTYEADENDICHGCEDAGGRFVILRESEGIYSEVRYKQCYRDLVKSEDFLEVMTGRFLRVGKSVKELFDWYSSEDYDNAPFDLGDIWRVKLDEIFIRFEDIYEEVPNANDKEKYPIEKQDFSEEMEALRKKLIAHIVQLCEQGMTVNEDYFTEEIGGESLVFKNDTCIPFCEIHDIWLDQDWKGEWALCTDIVEGEYFELEELSSETLLRIIASMQ